MCAMANGSWAMDYIDLKPPLGRLTEQQCKCVQDAIGILHSNQLVFGDLRRLNILVGNDTAMLVDFDWCGKSGKARYPPEINRDPSIGWPQMWDQIALLSRLFRIPKPPLKWLGWIIRCPHWEGRKIHIDKCYQQMNNSVWTELRRNQEGLTRLN